jgi:riboflavin-specific deaminase-like protein
LTLEQLFPERRSLEAGDAYRNLRLADRAHSGRPYVIANVIASVDGRAALGGSTKGLSNASDLELLLTLRSQVDAVMVGPRTIASEEYGPLVKSDERKEARIEQGLEPVPLAVTATRTLELPVDAPLFQDPGSRIVALTNARRAPPPCAASLVVEHVEGDELDLGEGMKRLRHAHGVRSLLVEGGPTILGALIAARLLDELFLVVSPKLVGARGEPRVVEGPGLRGAAIGLELLTVFSGESFLFLRYAVAGDAVS